MKWRYLGQCLTGQSSCSSWATPRSSGRPWGGAWRCSAGPPPARTPWPTRPASHAGSPPPAPARHQSGSGLEEFSCRRNIINLIFFPEKKTTTCPWSWVVGRQTCCDDSRTAPVARPLLRLRHNCWPAPAGPGHRSGRGCSPGTGDCGNRSWSPTTAEDTRL